MLSTFLRLLHLHGPYCRMINGYNYQNEHDTVVFFPSIIATFGVAQSIIERKLPLIHC